jgi:hypothetical protein|tara:strand:- start:22 stop:186 length:165 start_codon:yes stop_codon:yes gene_type:complete
MAPDEIYNFLAVLVASKEDATEGVEAPGSRERAQEQTVGALIDAAKFIPAPRAA